MSEPKRYDMTWGKDEDDYIFVSPSEQPKGRWVSWEDYARLLEEKSGWEWEMELTLDYLTAERVKVERLRKAGDAMELTLQADFNGCPYEPLIVSQAIHYWRAAKEGKQS